MKAKECILLLLIVCVAASCSKSEDDGGETGGTSSNVVSLVASIGSGTTASRSIIQNFDNVTGSLALTSGYAHIYAQLQGKTDWYINDRLDFRSTWDWSTDVLFPFFSTLNGTGSQMSDYEYELADGTITMGNVYFWPSSQTMPVTFYSYYCQSDVEAANCIRHYTEIDGTIPSETKFVYILRDSSIKKGDGYSYAHTPESQCDFLVLDAPVVTTCQAAKTTGVDLNYRHAMALFRFDFVSDMKENNAVYLDTITFSSYAQGIIDIATETEITADKNSGSVYIQYAPHLGVRHVDDVTATFARKYAESTATLYYPTTSTEKIWIRVIVNAHEADGSYSGRIEKRIQLPVPSDGIRGGYAYQYTIGYSSDIIVFGEPDVVDWMNATDDMYNGEHDFQIE